MIIGIDGNEANVSHRVGISEYAFELLRQFSNSKFNPANSGTKFVIYLKDNPLSHMPKESENWKYKVIGPRKFWTQFALPMELLLRGSQMNVFFTPSHYAPRFAKIPTVISVMDLSYLHFPHLFKQKDLYQLKNWTHYSVKNASKILTISRASKDDIIKHYKIKSENIIVTYPGIKPNKEMKSTKELPIKDKYILFVGTLQPRKNIERLIEAFSQISHKKVVLVIVGKKGWLFDSILQAPEKYNVEKRVHFMDFVSDEQLKVLYENAEFFILPSLYEGFGLPVLEAMQYGCPVITSNISSLPEVGGDAALYVNPEDTKDLAKKMEQLLENEKLKKELIKKGYQQVKKFSWEKTATQTLRILQEVASNNER